ncbi:MAG: transporter transrane region [Gemmatimonadetes bacterium]|nr:transporter transrane region [Gemmatimonadota bacterium]
MGSAVTPADDEVQGKKYDRRLARRLLTWVAPYRLMVVGALALLLVEGMLQLVGPLLTQRVIDVAIPHRDVGLATRSAFLFLGSLALSFACSYGDTMLTSLLGQRVMHDLRTAIFAQLQRLPVSFYDRNPVGRLVTRVTSDVEALNELFTSGVVAGLGDLFTLGAIGVLMLVTDWRLALAAYAVIPFIWLTSHIFQKSVREAYRDIRTRVAKINSFLQERLTGMRVVQLFGMERPELARFDALNRSHLDAHLKSITVYALYFPVIEVLTSVALATLIVAGARRAEVGTLTVGTLAAFIQLLRRFFEPLQDLSDKFNTLQQAMAASERIFSLLDERGGTGAGELGDGDSAVVPQTSAPHTSHRGITIEFDDVWFHYDRPHEAGDVGRTEASDAAAPEWVLRGVSFVAEPGKTVALVGHTGAGKTTIISLLLRFYEPQRGRILLNGVDVRAMPVESLRALVGYVQQDIFLFAGDVSSNIRLANPIDDEAVALAASRVGADRIIRRFPGGYGHVLGERGATISVGERQLLSFARAIAADPAVLVLDEATSAVDSEIEADIQRALAVLMAGRTTIAVAHRLSTIVDADEILVLHHGEVRERGRHDTLLTLNGLYERLWRLQVGVLATAPGPA